MICSFWENACFQVCKSKGKVLADARATAMYERKPMFSLRSVLLSQRDYSYFDFEPAPKGRHLIRKGAALLR